MNPIINEYLIAKFFKNDLTWGKRNLSYHIFS